MYNRSSGLGFQKCFSQNLQFHRRDPTLNKDQVSKINKIYKVVPVLSSLIFWQSMKIRGEPFIRSSNLEPPGPQVKI